MERCARAVAAAVWTIVAGLLVPAAAGAQTCALRLVWFEPAGGPTPTAEAIRESDRILRTSRAVVRSSLAAAPRVLEPFEIAVVLLPSAVWPGRGPDRVLGATQPDTTRAVWAFPDAVAATIGLPSDPREWTSAGDARFGRALGRVVAHEVFHLVTGRATHDTSGLMASAFDGYRLTAVFFPTEKGTRRAWEQALAGRCGRREGATWTAAGP